MNRSTLLLALVLSACVVSVVAQSKPLVRRPRSTRKYTTVLSVDGGGMRLMISSMILIEIEASIKRHILANEDYWPRGANFTDVDDFDILLADFFDAMSGVSAGSWVTSYLASKGGNGAAAAAFSNRRIVRRYGNIIPGGAKGLEVFFREHGENIYPGGVRFNVTPPAVTPNLTAGLPNATTFFAGLANPAAARALFPSILIPGLNAPVFPVEGLEETLDLFLGDVKLSELSTYYVVHAFDLIRRQNLYFLHDTTPRRRSVTLTSQVRSRNSPRPQPDVPENIEDFIYRPDTVRERGLDFYMKDIARGSSAAAGFHEAKVLTAVGDNTTTYSLIDGSHITNNPALQALIFLSTEPRLIPIEDIAMISLGSGLALLDLEGNVDSSTLGWLINNALITIGQSSGAENVQAQVDFLFYGNPAVTPGQYLRVQVALESNTTEGDALTRFTEPDDLPTLRTIGRKAVRRYRKSIDRFVADFVFA